MILQSELKHQRKLVRNLKKKSLWSKNLEEVQTNITFHVGPHEGKFVKSNDLKNEINVFFSFCISC